jgi:N12 class adenine-specific DNA methylase
MAFNKKQTYRDNIDAIKAAFALEKNTSADDPSAAYYKAMAGLSKITLSKYNGFGGLKCVGNDSLDPKDWVASERDLIPLQQELFDVLRENSKDEKEYNAYLKSIRSSVLTAFYTPIEVVSAISEVIAESGIKIETMLEPSAGNGAFIEKFNNVLPIKEGVAFEKDLITGLVLKHLQGGGAHNQKVHITGFENMGKAYENHFDLVVSNIPFGDFGVFDAKLTDSPERKLAQKAIHNYFFVKGLDAAKEGGLMAFITSQSVADSPSNKVIRQYLMNNANLISAIRLPNNLFSNNAGTQVGTDLIVLKKNTTKQKLSNNETLFVNTYQRYKEKINLNAYINSDQTIYTDFIYGATDQYGKPAQIYTYNKDFSELRNDLKMLLKQDFENNLGVNFQMGQTHHSNEKQLEEIEHQIEGWMHTIHDLTMEREGAKDKPSRTYYNTQITRAENAVKDLKQQYMEVQKNWIDADNEFGLANQELRLLEKDLTQQSQQQNVRKNIRGLIAGLDVIPAGAFVIEQTSHGHWQVSRMQDTGFATYIVDGHKSYDDAFKWIDEFYKDEGIEKRSFVFIRDADEKYYFRNEYEGVYGYIENNAQQTSKEEKTLDEKIANLQDIAKGRKPLRTGGNVEMNNILRNAEEKQVQVEREENVILKPLRPFSVQVEEIKRNSNVDIVILEDTRGGYFLIGDDALSANAYLVKTVERTPDGIRLNLNESEKDKLIKVIQNNPHDTKKRITVATPLYDFSEADAWAEGFRNSKQTFVEINFKNWLTNSEDIKQAFGEGVTWMHGRKDVNEIELFHVNENDVRDKNEISYSIRDYFKGSDSYIFYAIDSKGEVIDYIITRKNDGLDEMKNRLKEYVGKYGFVENLEAKNTQQQLEKQRAEEGVLFQDKVPERQVQQQTTVPSPKVNVQLNMFDLFDLSEVSAVQQVEKQQTQTTSAKQKKKPAKIKPLFETYSFSGSMLPHYREGSIVAMEIEGHGRILGILTSIEHDDNSAIFRVLNDKKTAKNKAILERYIELRDTYEALYESEELTKQEHPQYREQLNKLYDDFVNDFGTIQKNKDIIKIDSTYLNTLSLERKVGTEIVRSDIFYEPTAFNNKPLEVVESAQDALLASLNIYGYPNAWFMESVFPDQEIATTWEQLVKDGLVYYDPTAGAHPFVTKDKFLSGNMYLKHAELDEYYKDLPSGQEKDYICKGLEDIKNAIPEKIAFDNIGLQIGERWLPTSLYEKFAEELFDSNNVSVQYIASIDEFVVKTESWNQKYTIYTNSGRSNLRPQDLLKHALDSTRPEVTKTIEGADGKPKSVPDYEKQQLADAKITEIREAFDDFMIRLSAEEKQQLSDEYNMRFNGNVRPQFDGSHQTFPGLTLENHPKVKELYQSQKDTIWMQKQNGGGVVDHVVGGGKTLTMCITAQEMKRTGAANLPLIIAMNANVQDIADEYRLVYPNAKVCFPSEEDYSAKNRQKFFNHVKNNNWDVVIMSHDNLKKIPQDPVIELEILEERVEKLISGERAIRNREGSTFSKRQQTGLLKRIENTQAKVSARQNQMNKNKDNELTVNFSTLGFDHILVDESHEFKNLAFETRHTRVAGIGNSTGSQRSECLLTAIRTIQKKTGKDYGATFLSGTTLANSISELYGLFNYLRPKELERQGTPSFDAWCGTYATKTTDFEFSITGEVQSKERFRYFLKVPELAAMYNEMTDYRTAEDIGLDRPVKNESLVILEQSKDLADYTLRLIEFANGGDHTLLGIKEEDWNDNKEKARMLVATNYAKKASLDMRLIDPEKYGDDPLNKATQVAKKIAEIYQKHDANKGTQFVFSDLSVWRNDEDWNVYSEIKRKLVEDHNIPENEVAFIQTCKTREQKKQMIDKINRGEIRVVFGSTRKLGTGNNAQKRAVAVHHLDIPWRPIDFEQRDGRAIRTGNWIAKEFNDNKVYVYVYGIKRSLDPYKFNVQKNKQLFIDQLKRGKTGSRIIDEGVFDEETGMNLAEYTAILSGDTTLLEKAKNDRKISTLESERKVFYQDASRLENELKSAEKDVKKYSGYIEAFEQDQVALATILSGLEKDDKGNVKPLIAFKDGQITDDPKLIAEKMHHFDKNAKTEKGENIKVGEFGLFDILVRTEVILAEKNKKGFWDTIKENLWSVRGIATADTMSQPFTYTYNNGRLAQDPKTCAMFTINALMKISSLIETHQKKLEDSQNKVKRLTKQTSGGTWKKEKELKSLREERNKLEIKIQKELNKKKEEKIEDGIYDFYNSDDPTLNEPEMEYQSKNINTVETNNLEIQNDDVLDIYHADSFYLELMKIDSVENPYSVYFNANFSTLKEAESFENFMKRKFDASCDIQDVGAIGFDVFSDFFFETEDKAKQFFEEVKSINVSDVFQIENSQQNSDANQLKLGEEYEIIFSVDGSEKMDVGVYTGVVDKSAREPIHKFSISSKTEPTMTGSVHVCESELSRWIKKHPEKPEKIIIDTRGNAHGDFVVDVFKKDEQFQDCLKNVREIVKPYKNFVAKETDEKVSIYVHSNCEWRNDKYLEQAFQNNRAEVLRKLKQYQQLVPHIYELTSDIVIGDDYKLSKSQSEQIANGEQIRLSAVKYEGVECPARVHVSRGTDLAIVYEVPNDEHGILQTESLVYKLNAINYAKEEQIKQAEKQAELDEKARIVLKNVKMLTNKDVFVGDKKLDIKEKAQIAEGKTIEISDVMLINKTTGTPRIGTAFVRIDENGHIEKSFKLPKEKQPIVAKQIPVRLVGFTTPNQKKGIGS